MDEQKVLDNLYALRAGLSVISQKYDDAQAVENDCDEKLAKNAEQFSKSKICYATSYRYPELENLQKRYSVEKVSEITNKHERELIIRKKAYNRWLASDECDDYFQREFDTVATKKISHDNDIKKQASKNLTRAIIFFIVATVLTVAAVILIANINFAAGRIIVATYSIPAVIIFFTFAIVNSLKAKSNKKLYNEKVNTTQTQHQVQFMEAQWMLKNLPNAKQNARIILKQKDDKITLIKQNCNEFYMALKKQFNSLLDERDWQNLDLVIYELETRRADSVKEALQLVDRELQTERIQQTIALATEQICYEIRRGFAELKETIIECSRVISSQLSAISLQLNDMSGQLAELCDSVNMSNALQAKANVTSNQLLNDVHAIRYYQ